MSATAWMYLTYLTISIALTVWVGRTLHHNGRLFLKDVFGADGLADSVNHLLVVGFYLLNVGYVCLQLQTDAHPKTMEAVIEVLAWKVGLVLLVLGGMHFFNLFVFSRIRVGEARRDAGRPPSLPGGPGVGSKLEA